MIKDIRIALIGCGGISKKHIPNIIKTPGMRIIATMDLVEKYAAECAQQAKAEYFTTDINKVLSDKDIDAVIICSTHDTHAKLSIKFLEAGKFVFCEKPLAMTLNESRQIQKTVHKTGLQLMSGWWFKHSPVTKRLRHVIQRPKFIQFTCRISNDNKLQENPYSKEGLLDNAGYNLHWIWHVMRSQPVEVYAMGLGGGLSSTSIITIRFENGSLGNSVYSTNGGGGIIPKHYAEVQEGKVSAATLRFSNLVFDGTDEPGIDKNKYHNGFNEEMEMFHKLCVSGKDNPMDAWESSIPTLIFEKAVKSMTTGQPIKVDIQKDFYFPNGNLPTSITKFGDV